MSWYDFLHVEIQLITFEFSLELISQDLIDRVELKNGSRRIWKAIHSYIPLTITRICFICRDIWELKTRWKCCYKNLRVTGRSRKSETALHSVCLSGWCTAELKQILVLIWWNIIWGTAILGLECFLVNCDRYSWAFLCLELDLAFIIN